MTIKIRMYQLITNLLISKASFSQVVQEIANELMLKDYQFQKIVIEALQETAKLIIINKFESKYFTLLISYKVDKLLTNILNLQWPIYMLFMQNKLLYKLKICNQFKKFINILLDSNIQKNQSESMKF